MTTPNRTFRGRFADLSTSLKIFSVISLALFPLGLIALLASIQASRTADSRREADLQVAVVEASRKLGIKLTSDIGAFDSAVSDLSAGDTIYGVCRRLSAGVSAGPGRAPSFALYVRGRHDAVCSSHKTVAPSRLSSSQQTASRLDDDGLHVNIRSRDRSVAALASYGPDSLRKYARPSILLGDYDMTIAQQNNHLVLSKRPARFSLSSRSATAGVGMFGLAVTMTMEAIPFGPDDALLAFLPLLMWASAAGIGFLVVDRLLIRPLKDLQASVAAYAPGRPFIPPVARTPALEIQSLAQTFASLGANLAAHEADLSQALIDQTRLTREVHHRVKNNLQVVASLISLHARGAKSVEAAAAYAAIQRRVDALAIVHRNHYAELEENAGVSLKALLGELLANLRATALAGMPGMTVSCASVHVSQDSAIPIAFLVTELVEFSTELGPLSPVQVSVTQPTQTGKARLSVASSAFRGAALAEDSAYHRHARVLDGLARQIRCPLDHDAASGSFQILVTVLD